MASSCRPSLPPTLQRRMRIRSRSRARSSASSEPCRRGSSETRTCPCRPCPYPQRARARKPRERGKHKERGGYYCTITPQHSLKCSIGHVSSAHDASLTEMDLGELGIAVVKLELDGLGRLGPTSSDFGERVFEPVDHVDAHAMKCACHRIEDRFAAAFRYARHDEPRLAARNVHLKIDRRENRIVQLFQRRSEDVEDGCSRLGVLPADDAQQGSTLRLRRRLIDHDCRFALTLMNSARPAENGDELQTVKFRHSMVTLLDLHPRHRLAMSVSRQSVELAGAAVGAVAVDELTSVNRPVRVDHLRLPPLGESAGSLLNSHDQFLSAAETGWSLPPPRHR